MRLSFLVESPILYLALFRTVLATLFRAFGLPPSLLPSKPSFLHDHSTTQNSDFPSFLAMSRTDKQVNRSIQDYALTQLNVFGLRGFIFRDIHEKQGRSSSNSGYEIREWKANILFLVFNIQTVNVQYSNLNIQYSNLNI